MAKLSQKKCYEIAEKFCKDNNLIFIGVDSILKGNRIEITVGVQGQTDSKGHLIEKHITIGYGRQEINISGFVYTVIRNDNSDIGTDGISLFHFNSLRDAREWVRNDISRTLVQLNVSEADIENGKDYWVYDGDTYVIDWSIRKLPIQDSGVWTDPEYPVKYVLN